MHNITLLPFDFVVDTFSLQRWTISKVWLKKPIKLLAGPQKLVVNSWWR
jgi:hypothetical protein